MTNQDRAGEQAGGQTGARPGSSVNARIQKASSGLQSAVTGREDLIRVNAARAAKKLDERTSGRHHEKLRVALHVLDFVIDRFGEPDAASRRSAHQFDPERGGAATSGTAGERRAPRAGAGDEPEDLGEFRVRDGR